jgi:phosphate transport system substrate-binding protein
MMKTRFLLAAAPALILAACGDASAPADQTSEAAPAAAPAATGETAAAASAPVSEDAIRVVGSSTVYPFTTTVAEQFGSGAGFPTPFVESTGTGGGFKLFCEGLGAQAADITNASRPMKASEYDQCVANGVTDVVEVPVGFDGIVVADSKESEPLAISSKHLFTALARDVPTSDTDCTLRPNPYVNWSDIDPSLPAERIEVYGPPPTSGTRDAFVELAMDQGAKQYPCLAEMADADEDAFTAAAHTLREDGAWIDAGENDNAIVQTLTKTPSAFGVFGYSFLDQNSDRLQAATVDGVQPTFEAISSGEYPISRTLFVYVKAQNQDVTAGLPEFVAEYVSEDAMGEFGYLADKGLIPLPADRRAEVAEAAVSMAPMARPAE